MMKTLYRAQRVSLSCIIAPTLTGLVLAATTLAAPSTSFQHSITSHPQPSEHQLATGISATVHYTSSVDGMALNYHEYLPSDYNPAVPAKLPILLPSMGGNMIQYDWFPPWQTALWTSPR